MRTNRVTFLANFWSTWPAGSYHYFFTQVVHSPSVLQNVLKSQNFKIIAGRVDHWWLLSCHFSRDAIFFVCQCHHKQASLSSSKERKKIFLYSSCLCLTFIRVIFTFPRTIYLTGKYAKTRCYVHFHKPEGPANSGICSQNCNLTRGVGFNKRTVTMHSYSLV